jgi:hypothetical protein
MVDAIWHDIALMIFTQFFTTVSSHTHTFNFPPWFSNFSTLDETPQNALIFCCMLVFYVYISLASGTFVTIVVKSWVLLVLGVVLINRTKNITFNTKSHVSTWPGTVVWDPVIIIFDFFFSSKNTIGLYLSTLEWVFLYFRSILAKICQSW